MSQNICNICGANYEYRNSRWVCPGCGAYKEEELSNEEVTLLYNAAQKLRFADFDEAEKAYTDIIEKYPQNHNGYWGRLLSKYGIKYEEDFDGHKIPTCYATSIESVVSDKDYAKAISLADEDTKEYYQKQAEYIERVRKEWVEKARKEKPYDIFICYKDSDLANGIERTRDSVEALELYNHLQAQGYRVFFSRESLRNKVGEKYEPYIFNALSTAKVMLVYGTSSEYITSTWLKNEWTRYEKRMEAGEKLPGSLIVACDGFSPNELPKILSSKQCFDAKRKTFYIDLDKCIKRLIQESPTIEQSYAPKSKTVSSELHEHVYKTKIVKATCVAKGYTIHKCDCGYEYRDSYTPLVDHKFKIINEVSPTCTTSGYKEMACDVCGEKKKDTLPALEHNYSKWIESKHPTCTEPGEKQRKCTRCGEIEKNILPITEHQFDGWSINPDGTQTSYCVNCGCPETKKIENYDDVRGQTQSSSLSPWVMFWLCAFLGFTGIHKFIEKKTGYGFLYLFTAGLFYVGWITDSIKYYRAAKCSSADMSHVFTRNNTNKTSENLVISFKQIIHNIARYWKSYFTNEATIMQKIKHWIGCCFTLLFLLMFSIPTISYYRNNPASTEEITIPSYWVIILLINFALWICALVGGEKEKKRYQQQEIPYPVPVNSRVGMRIASNFLLVMAAFFYAMMFSNNPSDIYSGAMSGSVFMIWSIITRLYSHCPKEYKKIRFTSTAPPVPKINLSIMGIVITFALIMAIGVVGGITGYKNVEVNGLSFSVPNDWEIYTNTEEPFVMGKGSQIVDGKTVGSWYVSYGGQYDTIDDYLTSEYSSSFTQTFYDDYSAIEIQYCSEAYKFEDADVDGEWQSVDYFVICNGSVFKLEYFKYQGYFDDNELDDLLRRVDFKNYLNTN